MSSARRKIKVIMILAGTTILALYAIFETQDFIAGPSLEILSPGGNLASPANQVVEITGRVKRVSWLSLNGWKIFSDENGNFSEKLVLMEGINRWQVKAVDRFGREKTKLIEIVGI